MATSLRITISLPDMDHNTLARVQSTDKFAGGRSVQRLIRGVLGGNVRCNSFVVEDDTNGVKGSGVVTFASAAANATITVGGVVFTAKASGANTTNNEFNLGNTDAAACSNFANTFNACANTGINGVVTASASSANCTIQCTKTGVISSGITLASSNATTLACSVTRLTGGADDTGKVTYTYGG